MVVAENFRSIAARQKELSAELETECQKIENSDLVKENSKLSAEIAALRADLEKLNAQASSLTGENSSLKNALYEHVFNERNMLITNKIQKLDIYFRSEKEGEINKLSNIELNVKARIRNIKEALAKERIQISEELNIKLNELNALTDKTVTEARAKAAEPSSAFSQEEREQINALNSEKLTDEQIRAAAKKNNIERFVGLNVLNVIGILLLVVGSIAAMRFAYFQVSDIFKGVMIFVLGGIMLAVGEFLNRKKPTIFSLGISAGGIAILYVALAVSYFVLQILSMYPAIAVCVLLTAGAFVLSNRYNAQIIAIFALAGGYLPMISVGDTDIFVYGAMVYFAVLNILALIISWNKKWRVTAFIGLSLNIIGTAFLCWFAGPGGWYYASLEYAFYKPIIITYAVFAFLIYTAIPIIGTWRAKIKFRKSDVVLLAINTVFGSLIMFGVFARFDMYDYHGLLAIAYAGFYLLLGRIIEKIFAKENTHTKALFYLTGLAFVVMIIPLQFGRVWLSLGWLIEGVIIAVYGILRDEKRFKKVGFIICLLCLGAFLIFDLQYAWFTWDKLFVWKYTAITLGSVCILGAYMIKKMTSNRFAAVYKYFAIVNVWIYAVYIVYKLGGELFGVYRSDELRFDEFYIVSAAAITVTFLIGYIITRIKLLSTFGIKILSIILYCIGILWMFILTSFNNPFASYLWYISQPGGIVAIGTAIIAVLGLLSVFAINDLMKIIVTERKKGIEWLPLVVSGYFTVLLSQTLVAQYNISFSSAVISIIYVVTALAWIIFGFVKRFVFIRRFGLILAIFAVIKLFIIDLRGLTQGFRIGSYFALGVTLIAISFVYQFFSKKLELKEGISINEKQD